MHHARVVLGLKEVKLLRDEPGSHLPSLSSCLVVALEYTSPICYSSSTAVSPKFKTSAPSYCEGNICLLYGGFPGIVLAASTSFPAAHSLVAFA